mmetsp:Transcript_13680/g.20826  ORF Transcript_13680/g.20826 Transcript_13680/m.20826 type:complete len:107 (-) Transcript_13680:79-399(-)
MLIGMRESSKMKTYMTTMLKIKKRAKKASSEVVTLLDAIDEIPSQEISQDTTDAKDSGEKSSIGIAASLDAIDETSSKAIDNPSAGETEAEGKESYVDKMSKSFWD